MELEQLIAAHEHVGWCASERAGRELPSAWEQVKQTPVVQNQVCPHMGARCLGRSSAEMLGTLGTRTAVALPAWPVARKAASSAVAPRGSRATPALSWTRSATRPGSPTSQRLQQRRQQQWGTAVPRRHTRCIRAAALQQHLTPPRACLAASTCTSPASSTPPSWLHSGLVSSMPRLPTSRPFRAQHLRPIV